MTNMLPKFVLAIESAIAGGSISLLHGGEGVASRLGNSDISRAEDLLIEVRDLLNSTGISPGDLGLVAVSAGPGSFTGIRIGLATALGLKNGLGIEMRTVSVLEAMAASLSFAGKYVCGVPTGRNAVAIQEFSPNEQPKPPTICSEDMLRRAIENPADVRYVLHSALVESVSAGPDVIDFGRNLAAAVGKYVLKPEARISEPLFLSKTF